MPRRQPSWEGDAPAEPLGTRGSACDSARREPRPPGSDAASWFIEPFAHRPGVYKLPAAPLAAEMVDRPIASARIAVAGSTVMPQIGSMAVIAGIVSLARRFGLQYGRDAAGIDAAVLRVRFVSRCAARYASCTNSERRPSASRPVAL